LVRLEDSPMTTTTLIVRVTSSSTATTQRIMRCSIGQSGRLGKNVTRRCNRCQVEGSVGFPWPTLRNRSRPAAVCRSVFSEPCPKPPLRLYLRHHRRQPTHLRHRRSPFLSRRPVRDTGRADPRRLHGLGSAHAWSGGLIDDAAPSEARGIPGLPLVLGFVGHRA
jgi:hypothetical protein